MPRSAIPRRYLQLDVFADRPGAGNPLGVMLDANDLDDASMQSFAAWTNLSETIFLLPPTSASADYRVRIFTPRQELPFAGHPSVGAAWAVLESGLATTADGTLMQECAAGLLPVRIHDDTGHRAVHLRAPRARRVAAPPASATLLDAALSGLTRGDQEPALWCNGPNWWLVELATAETVRTMQPDLAAIAALTRATGAVGLSVYARTDAHDHQLVVRAYCPADNIPEDPVTGSANACIAAQLAHANALPGVDAQYIASQGRELGRDGIVHMQVGADGEVWIGGHVQKVIDGHVAWPSGAGTS
jgi:PhzF family phenazine biosynthesis protein